ncbi:MAG: glycine cleavage system protein H [Vicinamibacterales bacterium]|nr:glycine cleavage system protein H [Vicinamibacterales bacterium]
MIPHDILTLYTAKMVEYGIAVLFLLLFVPFWRFVQGSTTTVAVPATAAARATTLADWFPVPAEYLLHRGHAWARPDAAGLVTIGMNQFAASLVGPVSGVTMPAVGSTVGQGERSWRLVARDGRSVEMLSPIDGEILEVNPDMSAEPDAALTDPYGAGWLMKVRPSRFRANRTNLLAGTAARSWMQDVAAGLQAHLAPGLGALAQDGGAPIAGMARALDPERWDHVARTYLLTDEENSRA